MKTTRHTDRLVRLSRLGAVNAYLVAEDDGLTLVDTMLPRSESGILDAARDLGRPIVRIALTHAHGDHVGSLDALAAAPPPAAGSISPPGRRPPRRGGCAPRGGPPPARRPPPPRPGRAAVQAPRRVPDDQDQPGTR